MKPHRKIKCERCSGTGVIGSWHVGVFEPDECPDCGGAGTVVQYDTGILARYPGGPLLGRTPEGKAKS